MISGSIVALVTPMLESGAVDWAGLEGLVEWHIDQGTQAIVAVGTSGEAATLSVDEHCRVVSRVVQQAASRVPVIAGTGANATAEAIELTVRASDVGADACLLVTPYYNKPTQEGLYQHYLAIAEAVDVPLLLYNVPGRTACDMLPDTVLRLASVPGIVGIKEATGDLERAALLIDQTPADFAVYSGDDATAVALMLRGGQGNISVTANVAPAAMAAVCAAALCGDTERARSLDDALAGLHEALFVESNPIPVKWALQRLGKIGSGIRLPLTPLQSELTSVVERSLLEAGLL
jgi:4-hydroxy-tetrahydrodipicolinate synthase